MIKHTKLGQLAMLLETITEDSVWQHVSNLDEVNDTIVKQQLEQLKRGERPDGSNFPDYSEASVEFYGKEDGPIKWNDDGEFYESIVTTRNAQAINFSEALTTGDDGSKINLETEYNEEILGLQDESKGMVKEVVRAAYIETLREALSHD
jgi:hypothetical protein